MRPIVFPALVAVSALLAAPLSAFEIEDRVRYGPEDAATTLKVISTGDAELFAPVIEGFIAATPNAAVDYVVTGSSDLMQAIAHEDAVFDIAISSAMDLQMKLVNDGFARPRRSSATLRLPDWARWRDTLFAFTQEPATVILSRDAFADLIMPRTRQELIEVMRAHPERFEGRVGTYDIRSSGLGYLFATQDARSAETYWRLSEVMGSLGARLYCCSGQMIDDVVSGELAVAYNVLGSYARARSDAADFEILLPDDFTLVMLRTVFIPANSPAPELAGAFVDMLVGPNGQGVFDTVPAFETSWLDGADRAVRRIPIGPGLMTFLDRFKRARFVEEWQSAILQDR